MPVGGGGMRGNTTIDVVLTDSGNPERQEHEEQISALE